MKINPKDMTGIVYAFTLACVVSLIMFEGWLFKMNDVTWAIISGVICSELEMTQARSIILGRILATAIGIIIALIMLVSLGPGHQTIIGGVILTTLVCQYAIDLGTQWKLATATGAMILIAGLNQQSIPAAEALL